VNYHNSFLQDRSTNSMFAQLTIKKLNSADNHQPSKDTQRALEHMPIYVWMTPRNPPTLFR